MNRLLYVLRYCLVFGWVGFAAISGGAALHAAVDGDLLHMLTYLGLTAVGIGLATFYERTQ